jgi:hypothetical protein
VTGEEFRRLATLSEIRPHVLALRPQLAEAGLKDFWHLDEAERLLNEMFANPGATNFKKLSLSFQWHLGFLKGEFNQIVAAAIKESNS